MSTILIIVLLICCSEAAATMATAGMAGAALAVFLAWYWSLPSWSGWSAAWVSADRPPGRDILLLGRGHRGSPLVIKRLGMIRHLIERPAGW